MASLSDRILDIDDPDRLLKSKQVQERQVKNSVLNEKRLQRVARRQYSAALKSGDYGGAWQAIGELEKRGLTMGGIDVAGRQKAFYENQQRKMGDLADRMNGTRTANPNASAGAGYGTPLQSAARTAPVPVAGANGMQQDMVTPLDAPQSNLSQRLGLFDRMKSSLIAGTGLDEFREEARGLGIDDNGFNLGSRRAAAMVGPGNPQEPSDLQRRLRTFSTAPETQAPPNPAATIPPLNLVNPRRTLSQAAYV